MPFLTSLVLLSGGLVAESGARSGTIGGRPIREHWFDVPASATPTLRAEGGTTTEVTVEDRVYEQTTGALRVTDFVWGPVVMGPRTLTEPIVRSSSNESVVVPDSTDPDRWTCLAEGSVTLTMANADREVSVGVEAETTSGGTTQLFTHYALGSLRRHIVDTFAGGLAGKSPTTALRIFATQDHASGTYTRNTDCWGYGVDLTPISPWNSYGGVTRAGVLVSPRHVVFADHYPIPDGTVMRWVTAGNVVHERTLVTSQKIGTTDLRVGVLSADVPAGIGFARVLPASWATKLPSYAADTAVLGVMLDQEEKLLVGVVSYIDQGAGANCQFERPTAAPYSAWSERLIGGDSGNPGCLIVNGQLVILTCWARAGLTTGNGPSVSGHRAAINAAMTSLGGGYQLTDVDLSGFTSY